VRRALSLYPIQHPRLPYLIHDFAFVLIQHCYFTQALSLSSHLLPVIHKPEELLLILGTLARAAGGARLRNRYEAAERKALTLIAGHDEFAAAALIHLAEGARAFEEFDQAAQFASQALEIAQNHSESLLVSDAKLLLDRITAGEAGPPENSETPERLENLTLRLEARLRKWKTPCSGILL
jgi:mitochondrial fission protein ELM1